MLTTNTRTNLAIDEFKIDKGLITWCGIYFPSGQHARVYARVFFQAHQILPRDPDSWCHGNDGWLEARMEFPVTAEPMNIKVEAYGETCKYNHTLQIGLELIPWKDVPRWDKMLMFYKRFAEMLGFNLEYVGEEMLP